MNTTTVSRALRRLAPLAGGAATALGLLLAALACPLPATAETNLLTNPGFEAGYYRPEDIPELAVPNGWHLHYLDGEAFDGIAEGYVAYRPETVVWYIKDAPPAERGLFFLDGNYTLKIFKPWAPLYAGLSQDVSGLQPGAEYEWVANVYVDVIDHYNKDQKVSPDNEPEGVGLRLGVSPWGAAWGEASDIEYTQWWTAGNTKPFHQAYLSLHQPFVATASQMTVWVEVRSKFGYVNNGFFMDAFSLKMTHPPAQTATPTVAATAGPPAGASATPVPVWVLPAATATAVPTAASAAALQPAANPPGYISYTIQPGDTLNQIAQRYGVAVERLADLNDISNTWRIYAGQVIRIPTAAGQAPAAMPAPADGAGQRTYVVQPGDSLYRIALSYGLTTAQLAAANSLNDPRRIYSGQVLIIP